MSTRKFNWNSVAAALIGTTAAMTFGVFVDMLIDAIKKLKVKSKSREYYEKMLEAHPQLKKEDPELVAKYWASLFHYAPYVAEDPLSAGAFIRQSIDRGYPDLYGGPPVDTYHTLSNIQKQINDVKAKKRGVYSGAAERATESVIARTIESNLL